MELEENKIITGLYTINKIIVVSKDTLEIELDNGTTQITGVLRNNIDTFLNVCSVGEKIVCKGKVVKREKFYLEIIYISRNNLNLNLEKKFNYNDLVSRFEKLVNSVKNKVFKEILNECFNDDVKELFFEYPASKENHHNYIHGLLEHSVEVAEISLSISSHFENIDNDLLICGSLLHDIGKLKSFDVDENFKVSKTNWNELLGHLSISALFLSKITPVDADQEKIMLLYHVILSHHGDLDRGSPVVCKTKEAYIVNKADLISSTFSHIENLKIDSNGWTEKDNIKDFDSWYIGEING